jgi:hypothetical protein
MAITSLSVIILLTPRLPAIKDLVLGNAGIFFKEMVASTDDGDNGGVLDVDILGCFECGDASASYLNNRQHTNAGHR